MPLRLTRAQVREIDRISIAKYHIPSIVLMENAVRAALPIALQMAPNPRALIALICGGGNNGGDGLALARHLHIAGHPVQILLTIDPAKYAGDALINWQIAQAMRLPTHRFDTHQLRLHPPGLIIDAIFGTGLSQPPREPFPEIAVALNDAQIPVLAIDLPSGLDCDTGLPLGPACIRATQTITFVAEKAGFANPLSTQFTGIVTVGGIGCPNEVIDDVAHAAFL